MNTIADKIYRLSAPLIPNNNEVEIINKALNEGIWDCHGDTQTVLLGASSRLLNNTSTCSSTNNNNNNNNNYNNNTNASIPQDKPILPPTINTTTTTTTTITTIPSNMKNLRDGFTATEGYILLSADYAQMELRILAHFCHDEQLCEIFHQSLCNNNNSNHSDNSSNNSNTSVNNNDKKMKLEVSKNADTTTTITSTITSAVDSQEKDVFKLIASRWKNKPIHDITKLERDSIKQVCYACIYGCGPKMIAESVGITVKEATALMKDFMNLFPGISRFISSVKDTCRENGFIVTLLGKDE